MMYEQLEKARLANSSIVNKTRMYLNPSLRHNGKEFKEITKRVYCVASGIADHKYETITGKKHDNHVFCVYDVDRVSDRFIFDEVLDFLRQQEVYETDYPFDDPLEGRYHMIVYKIPKVFEFAKSCFLKSEYSKMYSKAELEKLFIMNKHTKAYYVMSQHPAYKMAFENELNDRESGQYASRIDLHEDAELEYSVKLEEEVFNYNGKEGHTL